MPRPKEPILKRIARLLPPGIDLWSRRDPQHWPWNGKLLVVSRKRYQVSNPQPRIADQHPTRLILAEWNGEPVPRWVFIRNRCGFPLCINPYHHQLVGCLFNKYDGERRATPHHEFMDPNKQVEDLADILDTIQSVDGWETMTPEALALQLHPIVTLEEIEKALPTIR